MRRALLFAVAALTAGLLVGGCIAEASLRVFAKANRGFAAVLHGYDPLAVEIEPEGTLGYRQRPNSIFHYGNGTTASSNALGYRGPVVNPTPAPGTIRVVLLGGSTTHGYGVPDGRTIDAYMREILGRRHPGVRFEVVNLAFDGYDSYQQLERFRTQGAALRPTIVVLNTGINDVRNAWYPALRDPDPRTLIWEPVLARLREERARGGPSLWTVAKHYSFLARAPGYLHDQLRRMRGMRERTAPVRTQLADASGPGSVADARGDPPYPDAAELFERHVRELIALALANGSSVLLSTPPSALRSYPPTATSPQDYWLRDARATQEYRDELAERLRAIAADEGPRTRRVRYVAPLVPGQLFLDDCHLKPAGNEVVAEAFAEGVESLLGQSLPPARIP